MRIERGDDMKKFATISIALLLGALLLSTVVGAKEEVSAAEAVPETAVAKIVFIDKAEPCECTQKKIDAALTVLAAVLPADAAVPVERLHLDTQTDEVEPWRKLKAFLALPALYFLDDEGELLAFLQGEVKEEQVRECVYPAAE